MGIFSFLGKKDRQAEMPEPEQDASRRKREMAASRIGSPKSGSRSANSQMTQRDAARATAKKIDAIESEMTSELARPIQKASAANSKPAAASRPPATATAKSEVTKSVIGKTLPPMGMSTDFLLGGNSAVGSVEISSSEIPPAIEEAAILFANEQNDMVEQMLLGAIHDASLGDAIRTVWLMLFDLYQITGKQEQFESLSIDFAAKFETSPPAWHGNAGDSAPAAPASGSTAAITFSGKLDENIVKQLERAQKLSEKNGVLRLEFSRVSEVDPIGCELLLATLKKLQKAGYELILVGAPELANKVKAIIEVGRRDENQAPWLLMLEILQLLNREKDFEEASIDYCITYEVSPPAFVAPKNKVSTAHDEAVTPDIATDHFQMPAVVDGRSNVVGSIAEFAASHDPAIIDCSKLTRVDFSAAGQMLSSLVPLAGKGRVVELHHVNHLVLALFQVMGLRDIVRIYARKN